MNCPTCGVAVEDEGLCVTCFDREIDNKDATAARKRLTPAPPAASPEAAVKHNDALASGGDA